MNVDQLTYRLLNINDLDQYRKVFKSRNTIFDVKDPTHFVDKIDKRTEYILNSSKHRVVGAFQNNQLVSFLEGYFKDNFPFWYIGYFFTLNEDVSLGSFSKMSEVFATMIHLMFDEGMKINRYGFYMRRTLKDERKHLKLKERNIANGYKPRYDVFIEHVYDAYDECKYNNHKYFFSGSFPFHPYPTVVTLSLLKPEYRKSIFTELYE